MFLPAAGQVQWSTTPATTRAFSPVSSESGNGDSTEKWSSTIGVVTAICGNILISFALNTQRYAHMRLSRDREGEQEKDTRGAKRRRKNLGGGTGQLDAAEERARKNASERRPERYSAPDRGDRVLSETEPLIPKATGRTTSDVSENTDGPEEGGEPAKAKSYLRSPVWWLGIGLMTTGEAGNFLAYGFAPASIVSPLGVVALISNCLIAPLLLRERFRWRDGMGVVIAVAGCVTVVLSASDNNPKLTPNAIWHLISHWEFETYFGVTAFLMIVLAVASNRFGEKTILIDLGLAALLGGYTALSTKGVASLLSNTIWRVVTFPITYLLVVVLVFTAVMQIKYINRALQRFNATMVIPTQFVLFTISVIVGSAVLYRDFERTTAEDAGKFVGGCALTFLGVWCITSGRGKESSANGKTDEEEDAIDLVDEETQPEIHQREDSVNHHRSPYIQGSSTQTPPFQRSHTADLVPSAIVTPSSPTFDGSYLLGPDDSPLKSRSALTPATAAAIHEDPKLNARSGPHSQKENQQPPPLHATTSAPIIPTSDDPRPSTPVDRITSLNPDGIPTATPSRLSLPSNTLDPHGSANPPHRLSRRSMAGLIPAPFTSPLSNSLSAIVADSLRRGLDQPTVQSLRPRRPRRSRSRGAGAGTGTATANPAFNVPPKRHSISSGDVPFEQSGSSQSVSGGGGRMRSMSATLSDIFNGTAAAGASSGKTQSRSAVAPADREEQQEEAS